MDKSSIVNAEIKKAQHRVIKDDDFEKVINGVKYNIMFYNVYIRLKRREANVYAFVFRIIK